MAEQLAIDLSASLPGPDGETCGSCTHYVGVGGVGVCWIDKPPRERRTVEDGSCQRHVKMGPRYECDRCHTQEVQPDGGGLPDGWVRRGEDEHYCQGCDRDLTAVAALDEGHAEEADDEA